MYNIIHLLPLLSLHRALHKRPILIVVTETFISPRDSLGFTEEDIREKHFVWSTVRWVFYPTCSYEDPAFAVFEDRSRLFWCSICRVFLKRLAVVSEDWTLTQVGVRPQPNPPGATFNVEETWRLVEFRVGRCVDSAF